MTTSAHCLTTSSQYRIRGTLLLIPFFLVLISIFMPWYPGPHDTKINGLDYLDNFFNELSKGSAYYIDNQLEKVAKYKGQSYTASLAMKDNQQADLVAKLFQINNIAATVEGAKVAVTTDLGAALSLMLKDADLLYQNDGAALASRYGMGERAVVYTWYATLEALEKDLNNNEQFDKAKTVKGVMTKAVEPSYNYYKVQAKPVKEEMVLLAFALTFYVFYTVWYGFGVLFLFEGLGIRLEH